MSGKYTRSRRFRGDRIRATMGGYSEITEARLMSQLHDQPLEIRLACGWMTERMLYLFKISGMDISAPRRENFLSTNAL